MLRAANAARIPGSRRRKPGTRPMREVPERAYSAAEWETHHTHTRAGVAPLGRKPQRVGELSQRSLFLIADGRAAKPHKATFPGGLSGVFGDVTQPGLEADGLVRRPIVDEPRHLVQRADGFVFH